MLPTRDSALQDGDQLHLLLHRADIDKVELLLAAAPEEQH